MLRRRLREARPAAPGNRQRVREQSAIGRLDVALKQTPARARCAKSSALLSLRSLPNLLLLTERWHSPLPQGPRCCGSSCSGSISTDFTKSAEAFQLEASVEGFCRRHARGWGRLWRQPAVHHSPDRLKLPCATALDSFPASLGCLSAHAKHSAPGAEGIIEKEAAACN